MEERGGGQDRELDEVEMGKGEDKELGKVEREEQ